ncbi:uncharacterized protein LOC108712980 isoform X2 [Xenopus laevis]|uniref:Uncharacterized protein LOC108712980 isoform X2 n=1 Tax=Xenopus laevis TaxID=8355 RepID=A0A8J1MS58_XENLA|nr:uncharacterized protein LOC108712980 isoform X2 [Xenopus laevis]
MSVKKWMWTLGKSCHAIMPIRLHHPGLYIQRGESNILCAGGGIQCITVRPISDFTGSSQSCTNKKDCVTSQSATQHCPKEIWLSHILVRGRWLSLLPQAYSLHTRQHSFGWLSETVYGP